MYADDVVTFIRPTYLNLHTYSAIVEDFVVASGLCMNEPSALYTLSVAPLRKWSWHMVSYVARWPPFLASISVCL
jgi:hypothetical protein